jgi:choline dehydrogenase-like flavoprotein
MEVVQPARLAGQAHHLGQLARRQGLPGLPAWICKTVGGTTTHWAGASLRFQEHEFRARTVYGDIPAPTCWTGRSRCEELEPYYAKAEDKMG